MHLSTSVLLKAVQSEWVPFQLDRDGRKNRGLGQPAVLFRQVVEDADVGGQGASKPTPTAQLSKGYSKM